MSDIDLGRLLESSRICICAGSGGVGKTTTSAALAAEMAARGRKVAVLTIDPARRLADSLGLESLGNVPRRVDPDLFTAAGVEPRAGGELWAMMLDAKATFDEVVERHAPDAEARRRILENNIYLQISNALAGSQEYMAMEKLYEIAETGDFDLLVLDTPPSRNALDFLDAPRRLMQFIEGRSLQLFLRPSGLGARVVGRGGSVVFSVIQRLTGLDLVADLREFFSAMAGMVAGFRERATRVDELLAAEGTNFVIVSGPAPGPRTEALYFHRKLDETGLPFGALIVNRVRPPIEVAESELDLLESELGDQELSERVAAAVADHRALAESDAQAIEELAEATASTPLIVPELGGDVHDLAGLFELNAYLFGESEPTTGSQPA